MPKEEQNLKTVLAYLEDHFAAQKIVLGKQEALVEDRPDERFYTFQAGKQYFLAIVRAMILEETVFPVLEGERIAEKMKHNAGAWVVLDKGAFGKGNEIKYVPR